jgi:RHS repeat-associated protein
MMRYLILLAGLVLTTPVFSRNEDAREEFFPSTPEQVAALSSEPDYLIGGLVSPLSGHPVLREIDLVVKGAQPIVLSRAYIPPYIPCKFEKHKYTQEEWDKYCFYQHVAHGYKGWQFYPHVKLLRGSQGVFLTDPSGTTLHFFLSGNGSSLATPSSLAALSNALGDTPSGRHDPRNTRISYEEGGRKIAVYAPDGSKRLYYPTEGMQGMDLIYLLEKEILPNGKVLRYRYMHGQPELVESLDPQERFVYGSLRIQGSPWEGSCHFTSSSGATADYSYQKRLLFAKLEAKTGHWYNKKKHKAEYNLTCPPLLTSVSSPAYRQSALEYCGSFLLGFYAGKDTVFKAYHKGYGEGAQHYRIHQLYLPVGNEDAFEPVYELSYDPPLAGHRAGSTTVKNSDGTAAVYHFSKSLLTTSIQYFGQDGALKKEKVLSWDDRQWLQSVEFREGQGSVLYRKSYEYDRFGNPIVEMFTGDLTGEGKQETFTIKRMFSDEGRHLLLREEREGGKITCFSYVPHTNLVTAKLTKEGDRILLREFSAYDDCNNLIQTISDDGASEDKNDLSQVTQRTITTYILRQEGPFLHMPEWIVDTYWEEGSEKLLQKRHLVYDSQGNVRQEEVYDATGAPAYTIHKTYNERGGLLSETNRLGQEAVYTYDARGRPETAMNFSHRLQKNFRHDRQGRLREAEEQGDDGIVHVTSSEFDAQDRRIQKRDHFQNTTHYTYDPLVDEVIRTDFPPIASIDGSTIEVVTQSTYDPFGRELRRVDANGNVTAYRYNAYKSPTKIVHPGGGVEHFRYTKEGQLSSHTDLDGVAIHYKRDILGRTLAKTYVSQEGEALAEETFTYSGFHLLTETDKAGTVTTYSYDGAGRKIREACRDRVVTFSYDALGELETICKYNGENALVIHYKRDLEGRVLEERKTDMGGRTLYKICYSYDSDGNRSTITRFINGKEAVESYTYDSLHRLIEKRDAEGHSTQTIYDENGINGLGQKVLRVAATNPLQITTCDTHDALARIVKKETLSPQGKVVACQELFHDPQGNLVYRRDPVYEADELRSVQLTHYTYTLGNQVASLTRAVGTQEARTTTYTYFPSGRVATKTLPDGVSLGYDYNPFGLISRLRSSDGTIDHVFEYDLLGHLRYAADEKLHLAIERQVDPFGNVTQERFPTGLEVKKAYDAFNRLLSLRMGHEGEVAYAYDPLFLRGVMRISAQGETLYSHAYEVYDEDGRLVSERLMGNLGDITHSTNVLGQETLNRSPYFSEERGYDSLGNLIARANDGVQQRYSYDALSQLSSEPKTIYVHDSVQNRLQRNGRSYSVNALNELLSQSSYDANGNQILRQTPSETFRCTYDPLNRLIEAVSEKQKVHFVYDPLGRMLSKTVYQKNTLGWQETNHERYLYHGQNEIGAFSDELTNLRVLGLARHKDSPATISVEIGDRFFAPIMDIQGNIRRLIDPKTKTIAEHYDFTAFGEELKTDGDPCATSPWRFASKRMHSELGLIHFGKRFYDPHIGRWLTTDPAGFANSINLYQYVLNNPFRYADPDGQFAFLVPLMIPLIEIALPTLAITVPTMTQLGVAAGIALIGAVGYEIVQTANAHDHDRYSIEQRRTIESGSQSLVQKKRQVDTRLPSDPDELLNDPNWEEISHPDAKEKGHRTFENKETGEKLRHDEAKPGATGHKAQDHWHRFNPDKTSRLDEYLDASDNPVPEHSDPSHLYPS